LLNLFDKKLDCTILAPVYSLKDSWGTLI